PRRRSACPLSAGAGHLPDARGETSQSNSHFRCDEVTTVSYATAQDVINRYPNRDLVQLTNEDPTATTVNDAPITQALADASAEIDGYIEGRFTLPLTDPPAVLNRLTTDIAMYRLQSLRPLHDLEDARKRYEDAVAMLTKVADGERYRDHRRRDRQSAAFANQLDRNRALSGSARELAPDASRGRGAGDVQGRAVWRVGRHRGDNPGTQARIRDRDNDARPRMGGRWRPVGAKSRRIRDHR